MSRLSALAIVVFLLSFGCGSCSSQDPGSGGGGAGGSGGASAGWNAFLPFTREEMLDPSTLSPVIIQDYTEPSVCNPGAQNRIVQVSYFSHTWFDGDWHGTTTVLLPAVISHPGVVAMADIASDWMDCTANELGIAVASVPDSDPHFGLSEIHDVYEHILCEMISKNDPAWSPYWPFVALRMRALTMVSSLVGQPVKAAYPFGSSINGSMTYSLALYDERVKGAGATGAYGYQDGFLAEPAAAELYQSWCQKGCNPYLMAPDLRQALLESADLYVIGPKLDAPVLQVVPTNDENATHLLMPEAFSTVAGGVHVVSVPNGVHSSVPPRVQEAFRMWIAHVELGRPVDAITSTKLELQGGQVLATAIITESAPISSVQLVYATMDDQHYLGNPFWWGTPDDDYTTAVWQTLPMQRVGDRWEVSFPSPPARFIAGLVDASDEVDGKPGYTSSFVEVVPLTTGGDVRALSRNRRRLPSERARNLPALFGALPHWLQSVLCPLSRRTLPRLLPRSRDRHLSGCRNELHRLRVSRSLRPVCRQRQRLRAVLQPVFGPLRTSAVRGVEQHELDRPRLPLGQLRHHVSRGGERWFKVDT